MVVHLSGLAVPWERESSDGRRLLFERGSLYVATDAFLWLNHRREGVTYASVRAGSLLLEPAHDGLYLWARLEGYSAGMVFDAWRCGIVRGWSPGWGAGTEKSTRDGSGVIRIRRARMHEISLLCAPKQPAFPGTTFEVDIR
ncbi:MAG: hypothetical protein AB7O67_01930 [Vicinamibacterales bacterium]